MQLLQLLRTHHISKIMFDNDMVVVVSNGSSLLELRSLLRQHVGNETGSGDVCAICDLLNFFLFPRHVGTEEAEGRVFQSLRVQGLSSKLTEDLEPH